MPHYRVILRDEYAPLGKRVEEFEADDLISEESSGLVLKLRGNVVFKCTDMENLVNILVIELTPEPNE